jgi:putative mRNA 3-end processing factor
MNLLELSPAGLYCPAGVFHIDPWQPVDRAVITNAHGDHLRWGSQAYLVAQDGEALARARLPGDASVRSIPYGEGHLLNGVKISLHPAGHVLGSSQVRIEHQREVWVVSGDYKIDPDPTCTAFEPIKCDGFVTESTFGLPIYRWTPQSEVFAAINQWWRDNQTRGRATILLGYALGKAQRLLAGLDPEIGPICTHGAMDRMTGLYRQAGVKLPPTQAVSSFPNKHDWSRSLILAPPGAEMTPWARRFGDAATGFASGWMQVRGNRRRQALDRGFALSDHADWPGLHSAIEATGAKTVWVTHGFTGPMVRYLSDQGLEARALATRFEGELNESAEPLEE